MENKTLAIIKSLEEHHNKTIEVAIVKNTTHTKIKNNTSMSYIHL
jgi:hypothetical protein